MLKYIYIFYDVEFYQGIWRGIMSKVLLTGGTGFIGSHTAVELIQSGESIVIVDDLSNSDISVLDRIQSITGTKPLFYKGNVADASFMKSVFAENEIDAVLHFAGYKAVGESVERPLAYYRNNIDTTLTLLDCMSQYSCNVFVFSSSATVYGLSDNVPFSEDAPVGNCTNPYGKTKYMIEEILADVAQANKALSVVLLRYFNPIGAHPSGLIGEKPNGIPNNLMPYITQVAIGLRDHLSVFGDDYPTVDGTGVRDYIHVVDLANGHLKALQFARQNKGCEVFNLGTGVGYSVLEVVKTFERVNDVKIPYIITERRNGDIATCYADPSKASKLLHWKAEKNLSDMCKDSWRWQLSSKN